MKDSLGQYAAACYEQGIAKVNLGQYAAGIKDFDTAIRFKPDFADAYYERGIAKYIWIGPQAAKHDFQTALKLAEQAGNERLKTLIESAIRDLD